MVKFIDQNSFHRQLKSREPVLGYLAQILAAIQTKMNGKLEF